MVFLLCLCSKYSFECNLVNGFKSLLPILRRRRNDDRHQSRVDGLARQRQTICHSATFASTIPSLINWFLQIIESLHKPSGLVRCTESCHFLLEWLRRICQALQWTTWLTLSELYYRKHEGKVMIRITWSCATRYTQRSQRSNSLQRTPRMNDAGSDKRERSRTHLIVIHWQYRQTKKEKENITQITKINSVLFFQQDFSRLWWRLNRRWSCCLRRTSTRRQRWWDERMFKISIWGRKELISGRRLAWTIRISPVHWWHKLVSIRRCFLPHALDWSRRSSSWCVVVWLDGVDATKRRSSE